ncbi:NAD(P)-binding protein [Hesseltinella vesiculosa]|uniref:NAD(P)-binding protein n=1 Tax=Hesseltinella vesiculosa TaxID=101127 RepID=A0A1X2G9C7_9FUNG|nr:NAD(P)-binding protein [Hesseltinella vesiculosa]
MNVGSLFSVKDKVVLVTGGSRGIGEMIATGFVQAGAKVYISSRSVKACDETSHRLTALGPGTCHSLPADLQKLGDIKSLITQLTKLESHLDVLVNNSGATWGAPIDEYTDEAFTKVVNLNLNRVFTLTQACLPLLRAKATAENPSRVINIGSVNGIEPPSFESYAYSSSKAGVHHLTRHLAGRLGKEHILVNAVAPGPFASKMMAATLKAKGDEIVAGIPVHRIGSPEDIAGTCLYLSSRAGNYTTGAIIPVDGGSLIGHKL